MNRTFSIIKPDAVKRNLIGHINQIIENSGLKIVSSKKMYLTKQQAEIFYSVHKERPFFSSLVEYMTCLLYTSPSPRDGLLSRMPSSA